MDFIYFKHILKQKREAEYLIIEVMRELKSWEILVLGNS